MGLLLLDRVPRREQGMSAYEVLLSESQERMLIVVKQGCEDKVQAWRALGGFAISGAALYLLTAAFVGLDWPLVYLNTLNWLNQQVNHYGMLPR